MGAFEKLFPKKYKMKLVNSWFGMLDGYTPVFSSYDGGVYEMELTRACIHTFATHVSKLSAEVTGTDLVGAKQMLSLRPNFLMSTSQFLYKVATILEAQNTCFIIPILDRRDNLTGYYPVNPQMTEVVEYNGEPFLRYTFSNGETAAVELALCGIVNKFLYDKDFIGNSNSALEPTMSLLAMQNQGVEQAIKNGASYRFTATINNFSTHEDLERERKNFTSENMSSDKGGILLFPNTYKDVKQVTSSPKFVDAEQMKLIQTRVFNYFGCNEKILQNMAVGDEWGAYYEGKIEPFAIQLSQAMTAMTYSPREIAHGNGILWSSNRLQYAKTDEKLQVSSQLFDRGILSTNQVMDVWNLPHVEGGDKRFLRKEYAEVVEISEGEDENDTIEYHEVKE